MRRKTEKHLLNRIFLMFGLLLAVIIGNGLYSTQQWNKNTEQKIEEELNTKLTIANSVLLNEVDKFKDLSIIVREQNPTILEMLDYDDFRGINIILQGNAALYGVDLVSMLDDTEVIASSGLIVQDQSKNAFKHLKNHIIHPFGLAVIDPSLLAQRYPQYITEHADIPLICIKSVVQLIYDSGDIAGHIILLKLLNIRQDIIDRMSELAGAKVLLYDLQGHSLLSSFNDQALRRPDERTLVHGQHTYFIKSRELQDAAGRPIAQLAVAIDTQLFLQQRTQLIISNLIPFFVTVMVSLLLFFFLKIKVFDKINQLIEVLRKVRNGQLSIRIALPVTRKAKMRDEITNMGLNFNATMDQLEDSYNQLGNKRRELEELNNQLREEIGERKMVEVALREAKQEADTANQSKSIFLANMSHEIRTPMNAILGYSQIMRRDTALGEQHRKAVRTIERSGMHLLDLINDILDISKIEAGQMELNKTDFDLAEILRDLANMFSLRCEQKRLDWRIEGISTKYGIPVHGDDGKLKQVLINLLGNAVKFTEHGSVLIRLTKPDTKHFCFAVEDTGRGISAQAQKTIFEPFHQDEEGVKKGGTGLGLAISAKQLELMGSHLQLDTQEGQGACFHFKLCLPPAKGTLESRREIGKKIIGLAREAPVLALVVDDVEVNRDVLGFILTDIGIQVIKATDGEEAVALALQHKPDMIFMDYRMPNMNGMEATHLIRKELGDEVRMIMVSAAAFTHNSKEFNECGCDEVIMKPFRVNEIYDCLPRLLNTTLLYEGEPIPESALTDSGETSSSQTLDLSKIQLPSALLERLREAAEFCIITEIDHCIKTIRTLGEQENLLAQRLQTLSSVYDTDGILEMLEGINEGA